MFLLTKVGTYRHVTPVEHGKLNVTKDAPAVGFVKRRQSHVFIEKSRRQSLFSLVKNSENNIAEITLLTIYDKTDKTALYWRS